MIAVEATTQKSARRTRSQALLPAKLGARPIPIAISSRTPPNGIIASFAQSVITRRTATPNITQVGRKSLQVKVRCMAGRKFNPKPNPKPNPNANRISDNVSDNVSVQT